MDRSNKSREQRLSPELMDKIQRRWGIVYQAVENEHAGELNAHPGLFVEEQTPPQVDATPVATAAIGHAVQAETAEEQRIAELSQQAATEAGSNVVIDLNQWFDNREETGDGRLSA